MERKLLRIINLDFDTTGQLLIIYSAFIKYLKKWEYKEAVHLLFIDIKKTYDSVRSGFLYNILNEFGIPMKMCLAETYNRVWVGKNLSDMFPIRNGWKQGDALLPLLFNFALEYAIRRVHVNQKGLELHGTCQLLVYAYDVNIMEGSVHSLKDNTEAFVVASKETGLEVNSGKIKYMIISPDQNARTKSQYKD